MPADPAQPLVPPPLPPPAGIVQPPAAPREYRAMGNVRLQAFGFIAGGALFGLMLLVQFLLMLTPRNLERTGNDFMPGILGGLSVIAIGMLARGVWLLRSVVRVIVDGNGMWVEGLVTRKWVPWTDVQSVRRDKKSQLIGDAEVLTLLDAAGRPMVRLPDTLGYFRQVADDVAATSAAAQGRATFDPAAEDARRLALDAKKLRFGAWISALLTILFGTTFGFGVNETLHLRRYKSEGVRIDARIADRYMIRVTPRLKYTFRDDDGRLFNNEVMMQKSAWEALAGRQTVAIEYVRSDPNWNRLIAGQQKESRLGGPFLLLSGGLTLVVGAMTVFMALGFDFRTDARGVPRLTRHGKPIRWQSEATTS